MIDYDDDGNVLRVRIRRDADFDDALYIATESGRKYNEDGGGLAGAVVEFVIWPSFGYPTPIVTISSAAAVSPRIVIDDVANSGVSFDVVAADIATADFPISPPSAWACALIVKFGGGATEEIFRCPCVIEGGEGA